MCFGDKVLLYIYTSGTSAFSFHLKKVCTSWEVVVLINQQQQQNALAQNKCCPTLPIKQELVFSFRSVSFAFVLFALHLIKMHSVLKCLKNVQFLRKVNITLAAPFLTTIFSIHISFQKSKYYSWYDRLLLLESSSLYFIVWIIIQYSPLYSNPLWALLLRTRKEQVCHPTHSIT